MKKFIGLLFLMLVAYLLLWPVPVDPQAWDAPAAAHYEGDFAVNKRLENFDRMEIAGLHGPEAVVEDAQGNLYATTHEGWIIRWVQDAVEPEKWVDVGGRPLGIAFDAVGDLWVANAYSGLLRVKPDGQIITEVTEVGGVAVRYADDVDISPNGKVYFSDASTKFSAQEWGGTLEASLLDINEHGGYGRIIEFDPTTKISRVVMDGLNFANGVAADQLGHFILVVETAEYRVLKLWLAGDKVGSKEVIAADFPGFPDNIHRGRNGRFWVGLTAPRAKILDDLAQQPFLRKIIQRLPPSMRPKVVPYGMVFAIDSEGKVVENLQDPSGVVYATTGVAETDDHLFVTSLTAPFLARYKKSDLNIQ